MARKAAVLSKAQCWEELPNRMIDDRTLLRFVCIGTYDEIGTQLANRYRRVVAEYQDLDCRADQAGSGDSARSCRGDPAERRRRTGGDHGITAFLSSLRRAVALIPAMPASLT